MTSALSSPQAPSPSPCHLATLSPCRRFFRRTFRATVHLLAVIGALTLVRPFLFDLTPMVSGSMSPTLQGDEHSGDWVLAEKLTYRFRNPRRWEIVEFTNFEGLQLMKRLAAFPGESIAVKDHGLQINGTPAAPPTPAPVTYYPDGNLTAGKTFHVFNGYYVLGDDSIDSQDSRYDGPIPVSKIRARAFFILWPPSRIGFVR